MQTKMTASGRVGIWLASVAPASVPMTRPGVSPRTISQRTAPCAWWARMLEIEVNTMVAIEVPSARCMVCSSGKPCAV